jgi:hypothetical protein
VLGPLGAHDRAEPGEIDLEHLTVQEQERAEGLVLRGGRHASVHGQPGQEARDLRRSQLDRVALAVEDNVAPDPRDVALLGAPAAGAQRLAHAIEQPRRAGFTGVLANDAEGASCTVREC